MRQMSHHQYLSVAPLVPESPSSLLALHRNGLTKVGASCTSVTTTYSLARCCVTSVNEDMGIALRCEPI